MITGSEEESRALMMNAAISIVARCGFEGFTTKKWAKEAGVAEGSLYYHFKSKDDLLTQAFLMIDREVAALYHPEKYDLDTKEGLIACIENTWRSYYRFMLDHKEWAIYFHRFRMSPRYTKEIQEMQYEYGRNFGDIIKKLRKVMKMGEQVDPTVLWCYVSDTTSSLVNRRIMGGLGSDCVVEESTARLIMRGLFGTIEES